MNEKEKKKGEGILFREAVTQQMIDDFKDFSKFFTKADEIEQKLYGHSDQLDFPGQDP